MPYVQQLSSETARACVGDEGLSQQIGLIAKEPADDGLGEGTAVAGVVGLGGPSLGATLGNPHRGVGRLSHEFTGLPEGAFPSNGRAAMEKVQCVVELAKLAERGNSLAVLRAKRAHRPVVRAVRLRRRRVAQ